jgi:hypothetical protein
MNAVTARDILDLVKYKDWKFVVTREGDRCFLHINATTPDSKTGIPYNWNSRKWRLSPHMVKGEIVQTAFLAIKTAEEHEMREEFKYRGIAIFGTHFDVDILHEMASKEESYEIRK